MSTPRKPRDTGAGATLRITDEDARRYVIDQLDKRAEAFADDLANLTGTSTTRADLVVAARRLVAAHEAWLQAGGDGS